MSTFITDTSSKAGLAGSAEKRIDNEPDGTLWTVVVSGGRALLFSSVDAGASWAYSPVSDVVLTDVPNVELYPSFFIDMDGYAHLAWVNASSYPQRVSYARGRPTLASFDGSAPGWSWSSVAVAPGIGPLGPRCDLVAFPVDSGWVAWVAYSTSGDAGVAAPKVARFDATMAGVILATAPVHGPDIPGIDSGRFPIVAIEFAHTGDGKTPAGLGVITEDEALYPLPGLYPGPTLWPGGMDTPDDDGTGIYPDTDVYPSAAIFPADSAPVEEETPDPWSTPDVWLVAGSRSDSRPLRMWQCAYAAGEWLWSPAPVLIDDDTTLDSRSMVTVWDGTRLCVSWVPTDGAIQFAEWDPAAVELTVRTPGDAGLENVGGISVTHDTGSHDVFLSIYDIDDGDVRWAVLDREGETWSDWEVAATRAASVGKGLLQAVRHAQFDTVDVVYAEQDPSGVYHVYSARLATLEIAPPPPVLVAPSDGAVVDLVAGATFEWRYSPAGPSDAQAAWQLVVSDDDTTWWWNKTTREFGASPVWNTGKTKSVTFAAGEFPTGDTFAWTVRTKSAAGVESEYATSFTVHHAGVPALVVTGPTGVLVSSSTPMVTWDYTAPAAQATFEVRIVENLTTVDPEDPGPAVWSSGVVPSSAERKRVTTPLENDKAYRAWVRVTDVDSVTSAWAWSDFYVLVDVLAGPSVVVTQVLVDGVPRNRVSILGRANMLSTGQAIGNVLGDDGWIGRGVGESGTVQAEDDALGHEAGVRFVKAAGGGSVLDIISGEGHPPAADPGEPAPAGPLSFPVQAGTQYTFLCHIKPEVAHLGHVRVLWYEHDDEPGPQGSPASQSVGASVALTPGSYRMVAATVTCPPHMTRARLVATVSDVSAGETVWFTRFDFHPGALAEWQPGGLVEMQLATLQRSIDEGGTWEDIGSQFGFDLYQHATVDDLEMPFNLDVIYRAMYEVTIDEGYGPQTVRSIGPLYPAGHIRYSYWVLRYSGKDADEVQLDVTGHDRSDTTPADVYWANGRKLPIVDLDVAQLATGSITVEVPATRVKKTKRLLRSTEEMVLQTPRGNRYRVVFDKRTYVSALGGGQTMTADYVETAAPVDVNV